MQERAGITLFKGSPVTLLGSEHMAGDRAPEFKAADRALKPVGLACFEGMTRLNRTVPSLDAPVCDTEVCRSDPARKKSCRGFDEPQSNVFSAAPRRIA